MLSPHIYTVDAPKLFVSLKTSAVDGGELCSGDSPDGPFQGLCSDVFFWHFKAADHQTRFFIFLMWLLIIALFL
jgi:hypothetical protein